ncbi:MAG: hypothetical protein CM1200mP32_10420 [Methanobacteriota archaeon]|nr:MAG: hypothetical protein CM1200mP32_10420 [Euryarchaeota archaeon]
MLVLLMLALPWSVMTPPVSRTGGGQRATPRAWGAGGSNDTGWISLMQSEPTLRMVPWLTLTCSWTSLLEPFGQPDLRDLRGWSDGYWATEPQITLMDTQTPILDWRDYGDLDVRTPSPTTPPRSRTACLTPGYSRTPSGRLVAAPSGVTISDLVIDALRPADPRVSFSTESTTLHDSATNPVDGRLYVLLDDDLLHLDEHASRRIVDIELGVKGQESRSRRRQ